MGGATGLPLAPNNKQKQQNNGPKPWFKVPKVCPNPKWALFSFISDAIDTIWMHYNIFSKQLKFIQERKLGYHFQASQQLFFVFSDFLKNLPI